MDSIKQPKMKEKKIRKGCLIWTRKLLETKLYSKGLIKVIHIWAVYFVKYSGPFLKWTKEELQQMNQRTRKLMTMHKAVWRHSQAIRVKKRKRKRTRKHWRKRLCINMRTKILHKKEQRKTNYSGQKQRRQHKDKQNNN